ncbi:unnamed protein product [Alopecurus aequalis]
MISPQTQHRDKVGAADLTHTSPPPLLTSIAHAPAPPIPPSTPHPRTRLQIPNLKTSTPTAPRPFPQISRSYHYPSAAEMNGYTNLASSPPAPSVELPLPAPATAPAGTTDESKWEGVAVGAATMVRNLSSASQSFPAAVERSKSTNGHRGGFQAAVRRAFSMRRQPASSLSDGYWRIHDGLDDADNEEAEAPLEEVDEQKKGAEEPAQQVQGDAASHKEIEEESSKTKKKRGAHIFRAWKKLLGFKRV